MAEPFSLEIVTPENGSMHIDCDYLSVRLLDGEAGFLKGHAPFLGALPAGTISVQTGGETANYEIDDAFLKVSSVGAELFTGRCRKL